MHCSKFQLALLLCFTLCIGNAQESDPWTVYMMPSEVHKALEKYTGEFEMEITMWMMEEADPIVIKVKSNNVMILGGRFLEMNQTGDMVGMPYHSISTLGYNNSDKTYNMTTITNLGTGTLFVSGSVVTDSNIIHLKGNLNNPINGQIIQVRQVLHFIDNDEILIENFDKEIGLDERRTIVYKLTRVKK